MAYGYYERQVELNDFTKNNYIFVMFWQGFSKQIVDFFNIFTIKNELLDK